ncbi:MAG: hypothetical protein H7210_06545 [Pyrinomonadaceae bacterium]|nr:hypothetical protein [Phycisphaerales bacterium]
MSLPRARAKIHPIIIVPAITATGLTDWYPSIPAGVWSASKLAFSDYARMMLYPSLPAPVAGSVSAGVYYEADQPSLIRPSQSMGIIYDDLVADLRHNLSYDDVPVQPVYTFAYDWRQDNFMTIKRLASFIDEVIERTRLMPREAGAVEGEVCDAVDLVGHSMGGCVIAGCLAAGLVGEGAHCKVRRVVTLGTPFRGATAALTKLATGLGTLTGRGAKERERAAARVTPSVYQLLPTFGGAIADEMRGAAPGGPGLTADELFAVVSTQPAIISTLASALQIHDPSGELSLDGAAARVKAARTIGELLRSAKAFQSLVNSVDPLILRWPSSCDDRHASTPGGWLAIVGAGEKTQISARLAREGSEPPSLDFSGGTCGEGWDGLSQFTGDETVPMAGAIPPWRESWRHTIVLQRSDFAWLGEMGDGFLADQLGFHSALPLLNLAQRWIVNFLRPHWSSAPGVHQHGKLWARHAPDYWDSPDGESVLLHLQSLASTRARNELLAESVRSLAQEFIPGVVVETPPNGWPALR